MRSVHPSMRASVCHAHVNTSRVEARPIPGPIARDRMHLPDADCLRQSEQAWTMWAGSLLISHMHRVVNVYNVSDRPMCLFRKTFGYPLPFEGLFFIYNLERSVKWMRLARCGRPLETAGEC